MTPHRRGPVADRQVEDLSRPGPDVEDGEISFGLTGDSNRLGEGAFHAGRARGEQGLVEMNVRVNQSRRRQAAPAVDLPLSSLPGQRADGGDVLAANPEIRSSSIGETTGAQDEIEGRVRHRRSREATGVAGRFLGTRLRKGKRRNREPQDFGIRYTVPALIAMAGGAIALRDHRCRVERMSGMGQSCKRAIRVKGPR